MKQQIQDLQQETTTLTKTTNRIDREKAGQEDYDSFYNSTLTTLENHKTTIDETKNGLDTTANYVEKYLPLYITRQMTDYLEYIFTDRAIRWRMNWYNEIRIPQLTACILKDSGNHCLDEKADKLHKLVVNNIVPTLPGDCKTLTAEEEILQIATRNRVVHARAKVIIM